MAFASVRSMRREHLVESAGALEHRRRARTARGPRTAPGRRPWWPSHLTGISQPVAGQLQISVALSGTPGSAYAPSLVGHAPCGLRRPRRRGRAGHRVAGLVGDGAAHDVRAEVETSGRPRPAPRPRRRRGPRRRPQTVAPRSAVRVATPSASVRTVVPSTARAAASTGASVPRVTTLTATSRGCSGVGSGEGTNGRASPHAASREGRRGRGVRARTSGGAAGSDPFRRADRSRVRVVPGQRPAGRRRGRQVAGGSCTGRCRRRARLPRSHRRRRSSRGSRRRRRRSAGQAPVGRPRRGGLASFGHDVVDERLSAPTRMDAHDQQQVHSSSQGSTASAGVSGLRASPGRLPARSIARDDGARVVIGLHVEDDQVAPRLARSARRRRSGRLIIRWLWNGSVLCGPHRLDHDRTQGQVVDEVAVHDVEMDRVHAAGSRARAPPRPAGRSRHSGCSR